MTNASTAPSVSKAMPPNHPDIAAHRLAAIVESSDDAIVSKDLNGIITSWNRAAEQMFGYTAHEAVGRSILLIIPEERRDEEIEVLSRIRSGRSVDHFETVRRRKDGSLLQVSLTVSPIKDSNGVIVGASKIARDITERKRAEAALHELDRRLLEHQRELREAAERGRQRAAFLAEVGRTLSASLDYEKTLAAVARLAVPRIADWCLVDVVDDDGLLQRLAMAHMDAEKRRLAQEIQEKYPDSPKNPGGVYDVLRAGRPIVVETIDDEMLKAAARDEGHLRLLRHFELRSYICVPLVTHGRPFGVITLVAAESGRRYTADDLGLAQEVGALASLAVANARAYRQANEANQLKDQFLATLSHELRTPLSAILGYTRLLRIGKLGGDGDRTSALEVVERNAHALKQIIDDVLDVSRIAAGKLRLNPQPVRLAEVVSNAVTTVLPAAEAKGLRVDTIVEPGESLVSGDPDRLQQVVWNLLSNAVKFTPQGGSVEVRLGRADSQAELAVRDTGEGVKPDFLPHMFERFRQGDSGFSRHQGGLGLGLAIVRELVELHGGRVKAESDGPGKGTTVRVLLPLLPAPPDLPAHDRGGAARPSAPAAAREAAAAAAGSITPPQHLLGVRVLVVDDEEDSVGLLRHVLESAGAEVRTAASASEALIALERELPDVLVSDIGMPQMDGLELIRRLRQSQDPNLRVLPALALTAYAHMEDRITALASGYHMHMAKPAEPSELVLGVSSLARPRTRLGIRT